MPVLKFLGKAIILICALIGALLIAAIIFIAYSLRDLPHLAAGLPPQRMVLTFDLSNGLVETMPGNPLALLSMGKAVTVRDALQALNQAAADDRVKVLLLRLGSGALDLARAEELADAVAAFRHSGKPVIAFAEDFGEGGNANSHYLLASAASKLYIQPSGMLRLTGAALQVPFLRAALDKLGIQTRMDHREEYKGAINSFTENSMPAPQRANMQALADSLTQQLAGAVAAGRHMDPAKARQLVEQGPYDAATAQQDGLIDGAKYWDQALSEALDQAGAGAKSYDMSRYVAGLPAAPANAAEIAVVYGIGTIMLGNGDSGPLSDDNSTMASRRVAEALHRAVNDPKVSGIIFRIDSGGGSYVASDAIWREVERAHELGKPLVVSMTGAAASGAYFISAPAAVIVAEPATLTGSIGVFSGKFVIKDLLAKLGITVDSVSVGANSLADSMTADYTPAQWQMLQGELDRIYDDFMSKVAAGRHLAKDAVHAAAKGQIWTGLAAKGEGLVDLLGGLHTATDEVRRLAKIDPGTPVDLEQYPPRKDRFATSIARALGRQDEASATVRPLFRLLQAAASLASLYDAINGPAPDQSLRAPLP